MEIVNKDGNDRLQYEKIAWNNGYNIVAGVDEAGRGPLAGPVVAACVSLPQNLQGLDEIDDSKKLSPAKRRKLFLEIHERACDVGIGIVDSQTIDRLNILQSTFIAMKRAVDSLNKKPDYLLIDGNLKPEWADQSLMLTSGESKSISIAAASIVAKEIRDQIMKDYDSLYPEWGFARHKGYGTAEHRAAIQKFGICDIHRISFAPITQLEIVLDKT